MDPIYLTGNEPVAPYGQIEIDDDDEEDELDSDIEEQQPQQVIRKVLDGEEIEPDPEEDENENVHGSSTNGRRKPTRKSGERVPGISLLPQNRLENILRADGEAGPMSKEAQFALSVATEEFIKRLAHAGYQRARAQQRAVISYRDMAAVASQQSSMFFLQDIIPSPVPLTLALERRALKAKELIDEDPALTAPIAPSPLPSLSRLTLSVQSASTRPTPAPSDTNSPVGGAPKRSRSKRGTNGVDTDQGHVAPLAKETGAPRQSTASPASLTNGTGDAAERRQSARTRDRHGRFSNAGDEAGPSHRDGRMVRSTLTLPTRTASLHGLSPRGMMELALARLTAPIRSHQYGEVRHLACLRDLLVAI
ncbi:hypothetical protein FA95DRAFT_1603032 [Auriscalpium vulgare]|uniref:Uncharacterized protein n=1 Tax=Auriscalpium vulgare TaxID=40419 RepID=A0ACB8S477_9AGAM|nr:hypothetical protein FA95DRAFT_1603032 [Auriscalpium vulgare]